jgi:hypothetical protein
LPRLIGADASRRIAAKPGYKLTISAPTVADAREIDAAIMADRRRSGELGEDLTRLGRDVQWAKGEVLSESRMQGIRATPGPTEFHGVLRINFADPRAIRSIFDTKAIVITTWQNPTIYPRTPLLGCY